MYIYLYYIYVCVYKEQLHCGGCFRLIQLVQTKLGAKFNWITCLSQLISVSHPAYFSFILGYFVIECNSQMSIVPRPRSSCSPTPERERESYVFLLQFELRKNRKRNWILINNVIKLTIFITFSVFLERFVFHCGYIDICSSYICLQSARCVRVAFL